jgi:hypothetical protein
MPFVQRPSRQQQTNIRPVGQRAKPLAPRHPNEKFGHTVAPKTNDHWEPTIEIRWLQPVDSVTPEGHVFQKLQQRWKCIQHTQSRTRPVELYFEWRDVPVVQEQKLSDPAVKATEGINNTI